jgi:hypothetical protein
MNMHSKIETPQVGIANSAHWLPSMPYQSIVPVGKHPNGGILYQIAGSDKAPCGAEKAFRAAVELHGGACFYCKEHLVKKDGVYRWTLDHVEPLANGGKDHLSNFVIACQPCNCKKANKPIDAFSAQASEVWLNALRVQIDARLKRLKSQNPINPPSSPPQPKPGAKAVP